MSENEDFGREMVIVVDGGVGNGALMLGTVSTLARLLRAQMDTEDAVVTGVFALNQLNELKAVAWRAHAGPWSEDGTRSVQVQVTFPDGGTESAYYTQDGNA